MGTENLAARVREFADAVTTESAIELVHVEITALKNKRVVRIYIDREGGVTHDDCAFVSHEVEKLLDSDDPIKGGYLLEVSSPGIERGLYSLEDFVRFSGNEARLKTSEAIGGQRNFRGKVLGVNGNLIEFEDVSSGKVQIDYGIVSNANLTVDIAGELQEGRKKKKRAR